MTGDNAITSIFTTINNSVLLPIYYGLLLVIGSVAAIFLVVNLLKGFSDPNGQKRTEWMSRAGAVLIICLLAGFAPFIVSWVVGLTGNQHIGSVTTNMINLMWVR